MTIQRYSAWLRYDNDCVHQPLMCTCNGFVHSHTRSEKLITRKPYYPAYAYTIIKQTRNAAYFADTYTHRGLNVASNGIQYRGLGTSSAVSDACTLIYGSIKKRFYSVSCCHTGTTEYPPPLIYPFFFYKQKRKKKE